jgi:AraC family transcriptional regulator
MAENDGSFHGLEIDVRRFTGAEALRVVHPARQSISEHRHDWPCLTLHVLGGYTEQYDGGEVVIDGPSAVLHPAGRLHANSIHATGLETLSITFDPAWLPRTDYNLKTARAGSWTGGKVALAAGQLAAAWTNSHSGERNLAMATAKFIGLALSDVGRGPPVWLAEVVKALDAEFPPSTRALAETLNMHPAWLARAYRWTTGEGTQQTLRRRHLERAVIMLRTTDMPLVEVAVAAGFYDQSHMNRSFKQLLGRTPLEVRSERHLLARVAACPAP